jgi:hypothetical protein
MMLESYFTALEPLLHGFRQQLSEDTRSEQNMFVGSSEHFPLLLLFSAVFLFGFSIRGMVKAVGRWGLRLLEWLQPQPQGAAQPQNPTPPQVTTQGQK